MPHTIIPIDVEPPPFRPWLRLAHIAWTRPPPTRAGIPLFRRLHDFEFVLQGEGHSQIYLSKEGRWIDLRKGDLCFLPPAFEHAWRGLGGVHLALHFDLQARPDRTIRETVEPLPLPPAPAPESLEASEKPVPVFRFAGETGDAVEIPLVTTLPNPDPWWERMESLVRLHARDDQRRLPGAWEVADTICWGLRQLAQLHDREKPVVNRPEERIRTLLEDIATGSFDPRAGVEAMAERVGLGQTAFRRIFREVTGATPRDYLERQRMERAARLLLNGSEPVKAVADLVGYDDPYHFSRAFRRHYGTSPRAWRSAGHSPGKSG